MSVISTAYYQTRNAGTRNNRTWNTDRTAEHPGTVGKQRKTPENQRNTPEYQRNMSGTPRNNETIQNKEKLWFFLKKMLT